METTIVETCSMSRTVVVSITKLAFYNTLVHGDRHFYSPLNCTHVILTDGGWML